MREKYIAVIQAGGLGTRMRELTGDLIPKPMLEMNGKPMLQWQIENVAEYGIKRFVIIIGHLGEKVMEYFQDGANFGVNIQYIEENEPLGSAGALFYLREMFAEDCAPENFLLIYGDVMFDINWRRMLAFHEECGARITLLAHPNGHPYDSDLLVLDHENRVIEIDSKNNRRTYWYDNMVNAGIYILRWEMLTQAPFSLETSVRRLDLETDVIRSCIEKGEVFAYDTPEYVKDAGTPERFRSVSDEQKRGIWKVKNLVHKQKCIFLDRDGTINRFKGLLAKEEELELEEGVAEAIRLINQSGYLAIVVTNQPVVARGMCEVEDVNRIHKKLKVLLGNEGAYLNDVVFCPHHPDEGYPEENPLFKIECDCRKPATGMIERMAKKYNINVSESYFVGDSTVDIQTGINAGVHTVLVKTGQAGRDGKYAVLADYEADNLLAAVKLILKM